LIDFFVFNATFNNNLAISWRSGLVVEEAEENHRPAASHWQTSSHNVVSPRLIGILVTMLMVIGTDCIGSDISNYYTIMTTAAPINIGKHRKQRKSCDKIEFFKYLL